MRNRILLALLLVFASLTDLSAQNKQEQTDSLVRLLSAQQMELVERNGTNYRKAYGPARFLHNNTHLICDTAYWHVDRQEIEAIGHVKILQEQTVLTGDNLTYYIDRDLAEFRGTLVQLEDKDHNMLRTRYLDYNTRDSVAVFQRGGAMKDKDGQIIESLTGTYDAKVKVFTFTDDVNMFTDSIFVKTTRLTYDTGRNFATFAYGTNAWKEDDMLSSDAGWYDRQRELFFFRDRVHGMTRDQEVWADSLFYWRNTRDVEMTGHAQLTDTTRAVFALAGHMFYEDSLARMTLTRDPAVIGLTGEKEAPKDTVWFGADKMVYQTVPMCDIPDGTVEAAGKRLEDLSADAVATYRKNAAEEAERQRQEALQNDPNAPPSAALRTPPAEDPTPDQPVPDEPSAAAEPPRGAQAPKGLPRNAESSGAGADSLALSARPDLAGADSLSVAPADSLLSPADSLLLSPADTLQPVPVDSTKIAFVTAHGRVRLFRKDIQLACDSLAYNDLDSLVRMYKDPIVWNEGNRQYTADSLYAVIRNRAMEKASLMSNAFIIIEEDPGRCYDQIRSTEMLAYFDSTGVLRRFDALGEANALFYLKEDSTFATVNRSQAKMLYAQFFEGQIDRIYYFDQAKNDAYPLAQMRADERELKGFNWMPDKRPSGPEDITSLTLRPSEREVYAARPQARFKETDIYYPGYMAGVYKKIRESEEARERRRQEQALRDAQAADEPVSPETEEGPEGDSAGPDEEPGSAAEPDIVPPADTTAVSPAVDSLAVAPADTLVSLPSPADLKALQKAQKQAEKQAARQAKEAARQARIARREQRWAELDSLDAAKARVKAEKQAEKDRQKKLKALRAAQKQARKDAAKLERYLRKYEKQKAKQQARMASKEKAPGKVPEAADLPDPALSEQPEPELIP